MHRKYYPLATAQKALDVGNRTYFGEKWRTFGHTSDRMKIMVLHTPTGVIYAPLYIHSFQLVQPHTLVEAEKLNIQYTDPSQIHNTPDKLRWYRYSQGLRQKDVAKYAGIDRTTYSSYEEIGRDYYPIETMRKIAELFSVPVTRLLDDFNLFLYHGQGQQIRQARAQKSMTQKEYAKYLGVPFGTLQQWEQEQKAVSKSAWKSLNGFKE